MSQPEVILTTLLLIQVDVIDCDDFKTDESKEVCPSTHSDAYSGVTASGSLQRWRPFCNQYEGLVHDFNFGTLLRSVYGHIRCLHASNVYHLL